MAESAPNEASRRELARYLRRRRGQIDPDSLGLPTSPRRRTTGLLREEVATLARVSTTWYTFLEQGRNIHPSPETLDQVADALQLDEVERQYVHRLAYGLTQDEPDDPDDARLELCDVVAMLATSPNPVYASSADGGPFAWNPAASDWYTDWAALPPEKRNMYWWLWTDPRAREVFPDWEREARDVVGRLRSAWAAPQLRVDVSPTVAALSAASPEFAEMWRDYAPADHLTRTRRMRHPVHGERNFRLTVLFTVASRRIGVIVHSPM